MPNTLAQLAQLRWETALGLTAGLLIAIALVRVLIWRRLLAAVPGLVGETLRVTRFGLLSAISVVVGVVVLFPLWSGWLKALIVALAAVQVGFWVDAFINAWLRRYQQRYLEEDAEAVTTMRAGAFLTRLVLFSLLALLVLDNIPGVQITALVAGLGIGGIAVALAVQNVLADLFASLSISMDKPFIIGDFIQVGNDLGTVESVGLKTTRVRSLSGEELIFPNSDLLKSRIRNYRRMEERRVVFGFGVTYQTSLKQLQALPAAVQGMIEAIPSTRFDRAHFKGYGDFALTFEVAYYVLGAEYTLYMDIQQRINLELFQHFEQEGIEFAYPTHTVYLEATGT